MLQVDRLDHNFMNHDTKNVLNKLKPKLSHVVQEPIEQP